MTTMTVPPRLSRKQKNWVAVTNAHRRVQATLFFLHKKAKKKKTREKKRREETLLRETRTSRAARDSDAVKTRRCGLHVYCFVLFFLPSLCRRERLLERVDFWEQKESVFAGFSLFFRFFFPRIWRERSPLLRSLSIVNPQTENATHAREKKRRRREKRNALVSIHLSLHSLSSLCVCVCVFYISAPREQIETNRDGEFSFFLR